MLGSNKVVCACFILVTQDGPTLLCLETRERERSEVSEGGGGGGRRVTESLLTVSNTAAESSHLLCPLPAFHTASVPDWSTTPEPTTASSLPPHSHPACFSAVMQKRFFFLKFAVLHPVSDSCESDRKKENTAACFLLFPHLSQKLKVKTCLQVGVNQPKISEGPLHASPGHLSLSCARD